MDDNELTLKKLRIWVENLPEDTVCLYALSSPFSWRGSYDEVAFSVDRCDTSREKLLDSIWQAYNLTFTGWKGGEFKYSDDTPVHFEKDCSEYSDGIYCAEKIASIEVDEVFLSQEERLMKKAFYRS